MSQATILPADLNWPSAVGNFLLNFGTLEYFVMVFLKDHLPTDDYARARKLHLKDRLNVIVKHLRKHDYPAKDQEAFTRLCDQLAPYRDIRNQLAHGHLMVRVDPSSGQLKVSIMNVVDLDAAHEPDTIHVEYSDLMNALPILTGLIEQFSDLASFKP
jgi:hypothetical protein